MIIGVFSNLFVQKYIYENDIYNIMINWQEDGQYDQSFIDGDGDADTNLNRKEIISDPSLRKEKFFSK